MLTLYTVWDDDVLINDSEKDRRREKESERERG